jgi:hypothetical protein
MVAKKPLLVINGREIECYSVDITSRYIGDSERYISHWEVVLDGFTDYEAIRLSSPAVIYTDGLKAEGELSGFQLRTDGSIELTISPIAKIGK